MRHLFVVLTIILFAMACKSSPEARHEEPMAESAGSEVVRSNRPKFFAEEDEPALARIAESALRSEEGYEGLLYVAALAGDPEGRVLAIFEYDEAQDGLYRPVNREWCEHARGMLLARDGASTAGATWFDGPFLCRILDGDYEVFDYDGDGMLELYFAELVKGDYEYTEEDGVQEYVQDDVRTNAALYGPALEQELVAEIALAPGVRSDSSDAFFGSCLWNLDEVPGVLDCETVTDTDGATQVVRFDSSPSGGEWTSRIVPPEG